MASETLQFQAEARQLLELMVHSIYSNKDIFLRELISNASDAIDKLRLESLVNQTIEFGDPKIRLSADKEKRTLAIEDDGIGMSRDEVIQNIGTIARSGTAEFLKSLKESQQAAELIGQFGVGFYSSFMVADKVELITRRAGHEAATHWISTGDGTYTVEPGERDRHGTTVILHLKPEDRDNALFDYTNEVKLREIIKRYSDFIAYPIELGGEVVNSQKAIWARSKDEVTAEEHTHFYKHITHDWADPLKVITLKAEGTFEYQALLFIPSVAPMDLYMRDAKHGLQLYVKRVFIMEDAEELLPQYLRFVKGVVDAQDLSLNISREILQRDRHIQQIRKRLTKKILETLEEMLRGGGADEAYPGHVSEEFLKFWSAFGKAFKEGIYTDFEQREKLLGISLFRSTHDAEKLTTLDDYLARAPEGQEAIYYLSGENLAALQKSPHLEVFLARGVEVLLLTDAVDEVWVGALPTYKDKPFVSAASGEAEVGNKEEREKAAEERQEKGKSYATLLAWMGTRLADHVKEVRVSPRLTSSPVCLVSDPGDIPPNLERLMRAMGQDVPPVKRVLEINPDHPLLQKLREVYEERKDDPALAEQVELLYGLAVLAEGGELPDPAGFSQKLADLLLTSVQR